MAQPKIKTSIEARVKDTGDTMTGNLTISDINYINCKVINTQPETTSNHRIDFGYAGKDHVDFYECGGKWNFYKSIGDENTLLASINDQGINIKNNTVLHTGNYSNYIKPITYGVDRIEIARNENLNDYLVCGNYRCSTNEVTQTLTNCPTGKAFIMDIVPGTGVNTQIVNSTWTYIVQRLYTLDGGVYFREIHGVPNGDIYFGEWFKFIDERGATFKGNIHIFTNNLPSLILKNTNTEAGGGIQHSDHVTDLFTVNTIGIGKYSRTLSLRDSDIINDIASALILRDDVNGTSYYYTLYGQHNNSLLVNDLKINYTKKTYTIDLTKYSMDNFYFISFGEQCYELDCEIWSTQAGSAFAYNQNRIHFIMTHKGWSDTPKSFTVIYQGCYSPSELTIMSIVAGSHNGVKGVYVRGGLTYNISSTLKPELKLSEYTSGDEVYTSGTTSYTTYTNATAIWTNDGTAKFSSSLPIYAPNVYGAVWNDYAEYRDQKEEIKPGYCAAAVNDGRLVKTSYRLQACDGIVSDTFGFAIGETEKCQTPLAVSGRVLAYFEGEREDYQAGDVVGAGPNGKIIKMTREEIKEYPDRIIGHVSEIPEYEVWGSGNVEVDGRIWIKVK